MVNVHVSALAGTGAPTTPSMTTPRDPGLTELADRGYGGYLTLELEDMVFPGPLSSEEKVVLLMQESEALQEIFS
jgi:hypothetical protein